MGKSGNPLGGFMDKLTVLSSLKEFRIQHPLKFYLVVGIGSLLGFSLAQYGLERSLDSGIYSFSYGWVIVFYLVGSLGIGLGFLGSLGVSAIVSRFKRWF